MAGGRGIVCVPTCRQVAAASLYLAVRNKDIHVLIVSRAVHCHRSPPGYNGGAVGLRATGLRL